MIEELAMQYGPLTTMWFDGTEPIGPEKWKDTPERVAAFLRRTQPGIMLSTHGGAPEDFVSFEAMVGPLDRKQPWEMAEQINPSGWVVNKPMPARPFRELLRNPVCTISRDGNYLLDAGPMQDGRLYPPDAERLQEFAAWMKINAEGVHGTRGGPYRDGDWGGATCKGRAIYLFLSDRVGTELLLPALAARVRSARRLDGGPLQFKADRSSLRLTMPDRNDARPVFLCVKLELDRTAFDLPVVDAAKSVSVPRTFSGIPPPPRQGITIRRPLPGVVRRESRRRVKRTRCAAAWLCLFGTQAHRSLRRGKEIPAPHHSCRTKIGDDQAVSPSRSGFPAPKL